MRKGQRDREKDSLFSFLDFWVVIAVGDGALYEGDQIYDLNEVLWEKRDKEEEEDGDDDVILMKRLKMSILTA